MSALSSLLFLTSALPSPAFLEDFQRVRLGFENPVVVNSRLVGSELIIGTRHIRVKEVRPAGSPMRERVLPRTPGRIVLAGTIQRALGGSEWDPDGELTQMTEVKPGIHELVVKLPAGTYEYKAARNGSWGENWGRGFVQGGNNISITVPEGGAVVRFVVDLNAGSIQDSINQPSQIKAPATAPPLPQHKGDLRYGAVDLVLADPVKPTDVALPMQLLTTEGGRPVFPRGVLAQPEFQYDGNDLGAQWRSQSTVFRTWSPVSTGVDVLVYPDAQSTQPKVIPMTADKGGTWLAKVSGNFAGKTYGYRYRSGSTERIAPDIYGTGVTAKADRTVVMDLRATNPSGWPGKLPIRTGPATDSILYELHVRDFTALPGSGVPDAERGKYAGLARKAGWLRDLGVTDIHLLPIQSFLTGKHDEYSWGYATNLFNIPEETYAVNPTDSRSVIREFKSMVRDLHSNGLRVVLDVVYNHTWPPEGAGSAFWQAAPYAYFRTNDLGVIQNESGVGNAWNDEMPMARKYVRDSLLYWLNEMKVDGFRFDLLGMFTPESVKDWAAAIRKVRPDATIYGEPWTGGGPTRFPKGAQKGTDVGVFNDDFRNVVRGPLEGSDPGFAGGGSVDAESLERALRGSIDTFAAAPTESINYVSAHDNPTLRDKIEWSVPEPLREASVRLHTALVLLSQGVPFLEGGVEIGRTKGGHGNSYDSGDKVNGYDWPRAEGFASTLEYTKGLIALRKATPGLRLATADAVRERMRMIGGLRPGLVGYQVSGPGLTTVYFNGTRSAQAVDLPMGDWDVLADDQTAGTKRLREVEGRVSMPPLSVLVLRRPSQSRS